MGTADNSDAMASNPLRRRIERRLKDLGRSPIEAAEIGGLERNYIRDLIEEKKQSVKLSKLDQVAKGLDWSTAHLLGTDHLDSSEVLPSEPDGDRIVTEDDRPFEGALPQMVGRMGGGSTGAVITIDVGNMQSREEVGEWWRIPPAVLRGLARADVSRTVGFAMDGDSMEPTIQRTDIVFIDTGRQKIEPDGIWAIDYGLGRTLKRITVRKADGEFRYVIKSDNKAYPDEEYAASEVTVFGRYVGRFSVF